MKKGFLLGLAFIYAVFAFPLRAAETAPAAPASTPLLVLVSLDAFRWDYCLQHPAETPHLRQLMREGVSARGLVPAYPSNTFPNHYTLVTGLYPSHHGIINNEFFDPALGEFFHYNRISSTTDPRWWHGEPIWITAVKQGRKSAASFWVGSEAVIEGQRPTFWKLYDKALSFEQRLAEFSGWLHLPPAERPAVIALYLEETNSIGHKFGPDSPELVAAVKIADARVGQLQEALAASGVSANLIIVSDHGMTPISRDRVIILDDYIDLATVQVECDATVSGLRALNGDVAGVLRAFAKLQHGRAYRTADLPARFHVTENPRNPDVWIVPEEGWEIYSRAKFDLYRDKFNHGDHGYDPALPSMHGIFIAQGPSFKNDGRVLDAVENIHLYNLLCAAAGLTPAPNDGDDRLVRAVLK